MKVLQFDNSEELNKQYPRVERLIVSYVMRGKGTEQSPCRQVLQVHTFHGVLLAENDPFPDVPGDDDQRQGDDPW